MTGTTTAPDTTPTPDASMTPLQAGPAAEPFVRRRAGSVPRYGAHPPRAARITILVIAGVLFLAPIAALAEFAFRKPGGGYTLGHFSDMVNPTLSYTYAGLFTGITNSLVLCLITVAIVLVLLLPAMILVELSFPRLRRVLEFICLIPITIPTVVLGLGFIPAYSVISQLVGSGSWTLAFAIGIIVLPYAYRPIAVNLAGVDVTTLSEAARSLGAGWFAVLWRVLIPNLRRGILASCFITIAVVLGEYTIASFLSRNTFQTALVLIQHNDPYVAVIFSLAALLFVFVLLLVIGRLGSFRPRSKD